MVVENALIFQIKSKYNALKVKIIFLKKSEYQLKQEFFQNQK